MANYGDRISQHLSAFLNDPRSMPTARQFFNQLDVSSGLHKPSATAPKEAKNDSNAAYLLDPDGDIAKQVFPALVEMNGYFSRTGPYFNASTPQGEPRDVDKALPRLRAQIQLKPLTLTDRFADFYPAGAIRASKAALTGFMYCQQKLKDQHKDVKDENFTKVMRSVPREDRYTFVGTTHLLLPSLRERSEEIPQMTLEDLDSDEDNDDVTLSPSKLKAKHASQPNAGPSSSTKLTLRDLPDPEGQYALTGSALDAEVESPRIYDGRHRLVPPHKYDRVNRDTVAIVETSVCGWEMKKASKFVTHLRIESIQLLDNALMAIPAPSPSPPPSPTPAQKHTLDTQDSPAKRMKTEASGSTGSSSTAKDDDVDSEVEEDEKMMEVEDNKDSDNPDNL